MGSTYKTLLSSKFKYFIDPFSNILSLIQLLK